MDLWLFDFARKLVSRCEREHLLAVGAKSSLDILLMS